MIFDICIVYCILRIFKYLINNLCVVINVEYILYLSCSIFKNFYMLYCKNFYVIYNVIYGIIYIVK